MALKLLAAGLATALLLTPGRLAAQIDTAVVARNDSVSVRFVNVDLRLAIQALARYLDRPVMFGNIGEVRVTLETPQPVARQDLPTLLRGLLRTYGLALTEQSGFYSVESAAPQQAPAQGAAIQGPVQLFVIHVRHARAADVAATVNALYGRGGALGESGGGIRPTLAEGLRQNLVPPVGTPEVPQQLQPVTSQTAELAGDVTIIPDPRTNSLLIRASRTDFDLIRAAVEQLDVRPLQVLIQVIIAEVRRDRSLSYGLEAILPPTQVGDGNTKVSGSTTGLGATDFILKVMQLGNADMTATLTAAASRGDVTILSRPVLLTANNESAEILVGSQRPFIQVQRSLPTDAPQRDQVIQFKDVGTRLSVRPTISDDGYVTLRVAQEVNAATSEVAFDAPVISTRTIQTNLLVRDGQTAVLGGLTDRQRDETRAGVPILSALPLIGGLFGRQVNRTSETELFVFLSPRVLRTDDDLQSASDSIGDRTQSLRQELNLGQRSPVWFGFGLGWGRFENTCSACASGDGSAAGYVKLGATMSSRFLIGVQSTFWAKSIEDRLVTAANTAVTGYFYPRFARNLFVSTGVGVFTTTRGSSARRFRGGGGVTIGAGYDIRVVNLFVTPSAHYVWGHLGANSDQRLLQIGLGITFD